VNHEIPQRKDFPTFQEYKQNKETEYLAETLSHYFNNELGTASNLLAALRSRLTSATISPDLASAILIQINEIMTHLVTVHEIGNIGLDLLLQKQTKT
jgi:hypothetical protein